MLLIKPNRQQLFKFCNLSNFKNVTISELLNVLFAFLFNCIFLPVNRIVVSNVQPGTTPGASVQGLPQDKLIKQVQTQSPQVPQQQGQPQQQPLTQIEQMQNMFQQQIDQKPSPGI